MIQLFVNVDETGNIKKEYSGENIVAEDNYDYFFLTEKATIENLPNLKVVIGENMKPQLVLKEEKIENNEDRE